MNNRKFLHCDSAAEFMSLEKELGVTDDHHIPLSKILHTMGRKNYLKTVIFETEVPNVESAAESAFYASPNKTVDRLYFFSSYMTKIDDIKEYPESCGGYCDLRPTTRTVLVAYIIQNAVIRSERETYAFLTCFMSKIIPFFDDKGNSLPPARIVTFPFYEKDKHAVMCAQAALLELAEFWNYRYPDMFKIKNAIELNRKSGVKDIEILENKEGRGLTPAEITKFFKTENVNILALSYTDKRKCIIDIYGFIESGFPVMICVNLPGKERSHAILCLGHTYDRNSWSAMAEIAYFKQSSSGNNKYHVNTAWVRNFIVHDDNFGPYYFIPTEKIKYILSCGFVVLPDALIKIYPSDVADIAYDKILASKEISQALQVAMENSGFLNENKKWLSQFLNHKKLKCGDGLVLRPIVMKGEKIINLYKNHEFHEVVEALIENSLEKYFWYVEITHPDIYCHRQECCGCAVIDANDGSPLFLHVPGLCVAWDKGKPTTFLAKNEDPPHPHYKSA